MSPKERAREHIRNAMMLLGNLGDPWSRLLPPKEYKKMYHEVMAAVDDRLKRALVEIEEGNA